MKIHASFWVYFASLLALGIVCRRWPSVALFGALNAFCTVLQAHLIPLPYDPPIVLADSILFVLPTAALVRACGMSEGMSIVVGMFAPLAMGIDERLGSEARYALLVVGIGATQGFAGTFAMRNEMRSEKPDRERRAAICLSFVGVLGLLFVGIWHDVAWCGSAAHAFVCLAYLAHEKREKNDALLLASEHRRPPSPKSKPRPELVEDAEERP